MTKFTTFRSVFGCFSWYLGQFEGLIKGYKRPVQTGLNQSKKTGLLQSFHSQSPKTRTAGPVFLRFFSGLETGLLNTNANALIACQPSLVVMNIPG